jgi:hypothetical protein
LIVASLAVNRNRQPTEPIDARTEAQQRTLAYGKMYSRKGRPT